jgi:hypothetical protein
MRVIGKENDNINYRKYKQTRYINIKRYKGRFIFKRGKKHSYGKFQYRVKSRMRKSIRYKTKTTIKITFLKTGETKNFTGISHPYNYYSASAVAQALKESVSQALAYGCEYFFDSWVANYQDSFDYKIINMKVLRLQYKRYKR